MTSRTATIDGIEMRWEEHGTGTPVVLVHGIPVSPALWRHVVPRLEGCRCLAWEMVGYGASIPQGANRDISIARQARYLAAWMTHLDLEPAILVGHDLGGGVVQIAAVRDRARCRGILLSNTASYDSWPIPSVAAVAAVGAVARHMPMVVLRELLRLFFKRSHATAEQADEAFRTHWPHYEAHGGAAAFVRQVQALDNADTRAIQDQLPALDRPTRIVWGVADQFQTIDYGERLARDLAAPLRRIDDGKHFTPEDFPEIFAEEIMALVAHSESPA
ncbi:MAG: alpha/beta fold hydrolase [Phycisphaerales bacterium]